MGKPGVLPSMGLNKADMTKQLNNNSNLSDVVFTRPQI